MGTQTTREMKINWMIYNIAELVKKGKIDKTQLLARFALEMSSTMRTGEEIINLLEVSKRVSPNVWENHEGSD